MDFDTLSFVEHGNDESLHAFLFENAMQHNAFHGALVSIGVDLPAYPIMDANTRNLDDWSLCHYAIHQAEADALQLSNPINMLDVDFAKKGSFEDWLETHLLAHQETAGALGL
jgi:hypothetical protein